MKTVHKLIPALNLFYHYFLFFKCLKLYSDSVSYRGVRNTVVSGIQNWCSPVPPPVETFFHHCFQLSINCPKLAPLVGTKQFTLSCLLQDAFHNRVTKVIF